MNISKAMLLKVVLFATLCVALTIGLGVKLANSRLFSHTYVLEAQFDDATGVLKGDAVKLAGVDIGRVESATLDDEGQAVVKFNLDESVELPTDSEIAIRWRNVLGQRYIYVYPGTDSKTFADGDVIPSDQTRDVNDIGDFLNRSDWDRMFATQDEVLQTISEHPEGLRNLVTGLFRYMYKLGQPVDKYFLQKDGSAGAGFTAFSGGTTDQENQNQICEAFPPDVRDLIPACAARAKR